MNSRAPRQRCRGALFCSGEARDLPSPQCYPDGAAPANLPAHRSRQRLRDPPHTRGGAPAHPALQTHGRSPDAPHCRSPHRNKPVRAGELRVVVAATSVARARVSTMAGGKREGQARQPTAARGGARVPVRPQVRGASPSVWRIPQSLHGPAARAGAAWALHRDDIVRLRPSRRVRFHRDDIVRLRPSRCGRSSGCASGDPQRVHPVVRALRAPAVP
jgi:hypothetical protein